MILRNQIIEAIKNFPQGVTCSELSEFMQLWCSPSYLSRLASYGDVVLVRTERTHRGQGRVHFYGPPRPKPMRYAPHVLRARASAS